MAAIPAMILATALAAVAFAAGRVAAVIFLAVTLAVGTPLVGSLEVTAASAAVRTCVYIVHDYIWSFVPGRA